MCVMYVCLDAGRSFKGKALNWKMIAFELVKAMARRALLQSDYKQYLRRRRLKIYHFGRLCVCMRVFWDFHLPIAI